jgi:Protein of unknown function (DUF3501)
MRKVTRDELLDYQTYAEGRDAARQAILEVKRPRRVHVGRYLTFLFENAETVRYQIQEMMRAERIVREADIQHELDTYNALLGGAGELGCCLLVEIDDREERDRLLRAWRGLPDRVYIRCDDGSRVHASYDAAQVGEDKISSVQYLKFHVGTRRPLAVGCDLTGLEAETELGDEQRAALAADLAGESSATPG